MGVYRPKDRKVWWVSYTYQGQQVRESTGTPSKKRAEQLLTKRKAEIFEDRFDIRNTKECPTLAKFAGMEDEPGVYLKHSKLNKKPQTYRRDTILIRHLVDFFGSSRLRHIKPQRIEDYKEKRLSEGRTPATVNREVACLKNIFAIAIRDNLVRDNPAKQVKLLREDNEVTRVLSKHDERKLLEAAAPHIRAIIVCALETGMRLGEILGLKWENVDLQVGLITVTKTKTGKKRIIPINDRLRQVLRDRIKRGIAAPVFWLKDGKRLTDIKTGYKAALRRAGLTERKYRFHDLRHTFATRKIQKGVDPFTVQELLGHASITTTQRYAHPNLESKRKAVATPAEDWL